MFPKGGHRRRPDPRKRRLRSRPIGLGLRPASLMCRPAAEVLSPPSKAELSGCVPPRRKLRRSISLWGHCFCSDPPGKFLSWSCALSFVFCLFQHRRLHLVRPQRLLLRCFCNLPFFIFPLLSKSDTFPAGPCPRAACLRCRALCPSLSGKPSHRSAARHMGAGARRNTREHGSEVKAYAAGDLSAAAPEARSAAGQIGSPGRGHSLSDTPICFAEDRPVFSRSAGKGAAIRRVPVCESGLEGGIPIAA